jgi:hypothetical protein
MSPLEAIAECRRGREIEGARWPVPLVTYLADLPGDRRVSEWLASCAVDLLDHLGELTTEMDRALAAAGGQAAEGAGREAIEEMAWSFWSRRSPGDAAPTAVAQLLFALSRADRSNRLAFAGACSTPICLLEKIESRRGEVFDRVVAHFARYLEVRVD